MLDGHFVIDATTHPYNLGDDNRTDLHGEWSRSRGVYKQHTVLSPRDGHLLSMAEMFTDFDHEAFAEALFAESPVDFAFLHSLPRIFFNKHDIVEAERAALLRDKYPNRFLLYANVNPLDTDRALRRLDHHVNDLGARGLKLYPTSPHGNKLVGWRMDDANLAFPVFERCLELGITNVAIHKAVLLGAADLAPFKVSDVEGAARTFPEIDFQIVHAGWAYLEETSIMMERYANIYANLEMTFSLVINQPLMFAEIIGRMLFLGLEDQIVFSDGCNIVHPNAGLQAFRDFQMPRELVEGKGYPELTDEIKGKILAGNAARIHGLDLDQLRAGVAGDRFTRLRDRDEGPPEPWAGLRSRLAEVGA
ncbi:MAG TPA: amidohydrolase family protein [Euzebyales bacterium]|nr:amidohydrolase family protein [Euzebyales bacterium]